MAARKSSSFDTQTASYAVLSEHSARPHDIESQTPRTIHGGVDSFSAQPCFMRPSAGLLQLSAAAFEHTQQNGGGNARYEMLAKTIACHISVTISC